jgi:hypothetical protein
MFAFEGPYTGAVIKFALFLTHHYPFVSKPAIKIISPTIIPHRSINKMDSKVQFSWDPEADNLISLFQHFSDMFTNYEPENDSESIQIQEAVELSLKQISSDTKRDMFSPCSLVWTDKLRELKSKYLNIGNIDEVSTGETVM